MPRGRKKKQVIEEEDDIILEQLEQEEYKSGDEELEKLLDRIKSWPGVDRYLFRVSSYILDSNNIYQTRQNAFRMPVTGNLPTACQLYNRRHGNKAKDYIIEIVDAQDQPVLDPKTDKPVCFAYHVEPDETTITEETEKKILSQGYKEDEKKEDSTISDFLDEQIKNLEKETRLAYIQNKLQSIKKQNETTKEPDFVSLVLKQQEAAMEREREQQAKHLELLSKIIEKKDDGASPEYMKIILEQQKEAFLKEKEYQERQMQILAEMMKNKQEQPSIDREIILPLVQAALTKPSPPPQTENVLFIEMIRGLQQEKQEFQKQQWEMQKTILELVQQKNEPQDPLESVDRLWSIIESIGNKVAGVTNSDNPWMYAVKEGMQTVKDIATTFIEAKKITPKPQKLYTPTPPKIAALPNIPKFPKPQTLTPTQTPEESAIEEPKQELQELPEIPKEVQENIQKQLENEVKNAAPAILQAASNNQDPKSISVLIADRYPIVTQILKTIPLDTLADKLEEFKKTATDEDKHTLESLCLALKSNSPCRAWFDKLVEQL